MQVQGQVLCQSVGSAAQPDWQELTEQTQAVPHSQLQRCHDRRSLHLTDLHSMTNAVPQGLAQCDDAANGTAHKVHGRHSMHQRLPLWAASVLISPAEPYMHKLVFACIDLHDNATLLPDTESISVMKGNLLLTQQIYSRQRHHLGELQHKLATACQQ